MVIGGISLSASLCVGFRLRQALHCGAKGSPSSSRLELPKKRASAVQDLPHCPRDLPTWTPMVRAWGRKMECSGWPHVHPWHQWSGQAHPRELIWVWGRGGPQRRRGQAESTDNHTDGFPIHPNPWYPVERTGLQAGGLPSRLNCPWLLHTSASSTVKLIRSSYLANQMVWLQCRDWILNFFPPSSPSLPLPCSFVHLFIHSFSIGSCAGHTMVNKQNGPCVCGAYSLEQRLQSEGQQIMWPLDIFFNL